MRLFLEKMLSRRAVLAGSAAAVCATHSAAQVPATAPEPLLRTLSLAPLKAHLKAGGAPSDMLAAGGSFPGPTIRVTKGRPVELTVENRLDQPTCLAIHGLRGPNTAQQVPGLGAAALAPGETRTLRIETPDSGTYLYGPTLQGRTGEQMERGLAGFFIVEESTPQLADLDLPLALDDVRLTENGALAGDHNALVDATRAGRLGNALIVNGQPAPLTVTVRPNARIRLRLGGFFNARVAPMRFENVKATVVAVDGQGCDPFDPLKRTVVMMPGTRYELFLDAPATAGEEGRALLALGNGLPVLVLRTEGDPLPVRPPVQPLALNDLPPSIRLQNAHRVEMAISGGLAKGQPLPPPADLARLFPDRSRIFTVNDGINSGLSGKPLFSVKRGTPVVLALANRTDWAQILTVHGHVIRLLHPLDDGWEPYFLDTIYLPDRTTSRIAFDAVNAGKWAIRSTIPEHYDGGVATWFEVV